MYGFRAGRKCSSLTSTPRSIKRANLHLYIATWRLVLDAPDTLPLFLLVQKIDVGLQVNITHWISTLSCYSLAYYQGESEWNSTLIPPVWRQAVPDLGVFNSLGVIGPQMSLSMWPVPYLHIMRGLRAGAVITHWALYLTTSNNC